MWLLQARLLAPSRIGADLVAATVSIAGRAIIGTAAVI
jgi:hypothetical protein